MEQQNERVAEKKKCQEQRRKRLELSIYMFLGIKVMGRLVLRLLCSQAKEGKQIYFVVLCGMIALLSYLLFKKSVEKVVTP